MSAFGRCLCISLTAPLYYQTIVAFLCGVFEQFANRFSGVFKGGPNLPGRRAGSFSEYRPLGWDSAYRNGEPRVFPDRTAGSFSANVLGVGPQRVSVGAGLESCNSDDRCPRQKTGRSCWGSGQQDASDSEADAGCRNPSLFAEKAPCWPAHIALTAPRKIPWRCRRCVWHPWRTSPRRSSRHIPGSARHRPP